MNSADIVKPTLLLNSNIARQNLVRMRQKAEANNVSFRPHFKTHQSHEIGRWFREMGVSRITVSSLDMATYFAQDGWDDITVAFPFNVLEHKVASELARQIKLNLVVESVEVVSFLEKSEIKGVELFIKVDAGYHRTGVSVENTDALQAIINHIKTSRHSFGGFLVHDGHTYKARGKDEILAIHRETMSHIASLKQFFEGTYPDITYSLGDTPSFSVIDHFQGIDEIRPGNFIFYDLAQWQIGSCSMEDIAVCMACPIVAFHPSRNEIVLYGGGVHFSKDRILHHGKEVYGLPVQLHEHGWSMPEEDVYVKSLSQEHGILHVTDEYFDRYRVGDLIGILPVHSCLTSNEMKSYRTLTGHLISRL